MQPMGIHVCVRDIVPCSPWGFMYVLEIKSMQPMGIHVCVRDIVHAAHGDSCMC